ncbi:zinc knuckle [Ostertagia ostertagi]
MLDTNVLQVRDVVGEIQKLQEKQAKDMMRNQDELSDEDMDDDDTSVRAESRNSADWSSLRAALETAFGSRWETAAEQTATEFLRRFRRKYGPLGYGDRTLLEILEDDHLGEKAKNVFLAIPQEKLEEGFEAVVRELERLLSSDSRAVAYKSQRDSERLRSNPEERHLVHEDGQKQDVETRKCFICLKVGHIARNCPLGRATVNSIREKRTKTKENMEETRVSDLVRQARSMGMVVEKCSATSNLVGRKLTAWVSALNERVPALIDTGSMVSIVSIGLLAKAQDNGFDVDSLRVIDREALNPVFDASGSRMQFLGGVVIVVKIDGGTESEIAFYISKEKGQKILLGTNALQKLGVQIKLPIPVPVATRRTSDTGRVTIARRKYVAPLTSSLLQTRCEGEEDSVERGR